MKISNVGMIKVSDKISISIFTFAALFFFFSSQRLLYSFLFVLSAALHECSHIYFLCRYGAEIKSLYIFPFGIDINADTRLLSYKKELICTLAGSFSNLIFAVAVFLVLLFFPSPPLLFFVMCNAFLGCMNLIPLSFFDGGKALRLILYDRFDIDTAYYVHKVFDIVSAFIFLFFSMLLITGSSFNFSVCAVIIYAAISTFANPIKNKTP